MNINPIWIPVSLALLVVGGLLGGCEAAQQSVQGAADEAAAKVKSSAEEATADLKKQAQAELEKAASEAGKKVGDAVDPSGAKREAVAKLSEGQAMLQKIQEGRIMDPEVQTWIKNTAADGSAAAQAAVAPVMAKAYERFPSDRKWLEQEATKARDKATGSIKEAWSAVLDNFERLKSLAEAQR